MKRLILIGIVAVLLFGCKSALDKKVTQENFVSVKEFITKSDTIKELKKQYLINKLSFDVAGYELGKLITKKDIDDKTFRVLFNEYSSEYNEKEKAYNFIEIKDASTTAYKLGKYFSYLFKTLNFNLNFNNAFKKDILYIEVNCKYIDKYDKVLLDKNIRIKDEDTQNFKTPQTLPLLFGSFDVEFIRPAAVDSLTNIQRLKNCKIIPTVIVFKDKSRIDLPETEFKYFGKK